MCSGTCKYIIMIEVIMIEEGLENKYCTKTLNTCEVAE